jgi:hypothetical protein
MWIAKALKALLLTLVTAGSLGQAYPPNVAWRPRTRPAPLFAAEPQYWDPSAAKRPA